MSENEILCALAEIIAEISGTDHNKVVRDASFTEDLGIDSIEKAEIVFALEDKFHIEIPDADAKELLTVSDAISYICKHLPQDLVQ